MIKLYELYPTFGKFSVKTVDYRGDVIGVAAVSVKQALYFAYKGAWANDPETPLGIVWECRKHRTPDTVMWTGEKKWGFAPRHRASHRQITASMLKDLERLREQSVKKS